MLNGDGDEAVDVDIQILTARDLGELMHLANDMTEMRATNRIKSAGECCIGAVRAIAALIACERAVRGYLRLEQARDFGFQPIILAIAWCEGGEGVWTG